MKIYLLLFTCVIKICQNYSYKHHRSNRQPLAFGPFKTIVHPYDLDKKPQQNLINHPDYKLMGPSQAATNSKVADPSSKGYYDPTNPGSCQSVPSVDTSIRDMTAHNMVLQDKARINQNSPLAYYDPTENMDNNLIENLKNTDLYVVPIEIQDDLRDGDKNHLYMKENLKKQTQSIRNREKYYYDPSVNPYFNYVDKDSHLQQPIADHLARPQTMTIQQWYKDQQKQENLKKMVVSPADRNIGYYKLVFYLREINQRLNQRSIRLQQNAYVGVKLKDEKLPNISVSVGGRKKRRIRRR